MGKLFGTESGEDTTLPLNREAVRDDAEAAPAKWHEWGDFFISFGYVTRDGKQYPQTKAYYSQAGTSMEWDGIARYALLAWIFEQARKFLPAAALRAAVPNETAPALAVPQTNRAVEESFRESGETDLVIEGLKLAEISATRPGPARLLATGRLRLKGTSVTFEHEKPGADYRVDLFLVRQPEQRYADQIQTDQPLQCDAEHYVAAQTGQFREGLPEEEAMQEFRVDFPAPGVGRYRLKSVVTLLASGKTSAQAAGPFLCVE